MIGGLDMGIREQSDSGVSKVACRFETNNPESGLERQVCIHIYNSLSYSFYSKTQKPGMELKVKCIATD